jgi:hypothetical protein
LVEALMRPVLVEASGICVEDRDGVRLVVDQHPVGALLSDAADEPLGVAVRPRRAGRDLDDLHVLAREHCVEHLGAFRVPITKEEPEGTGPLAEAH